MVSDGTRSPWTHTEEASKTELFLLEHLHQSFLVIIMENKLPLASCAKMASCQLFRSQLISVHQSSLPEWLSSSSYEKYADGKLKHSSGLALLFHGCELALSHIFCLPLPSVLYPCRLPACVSCGKFQEKPFSWINTLNFPLFTKKHTQIGCLLMFAYLFPFSYCGSIGLGRFP